jgi:hypothetical protein
VSHAGLGSKETRHARKLPSPSLWRPPQHLHRRTSRAGSPRDSSYDLLIYTGVARIRRAHHEQRRFRAFLAVFLLNSPSIPPRLLLLDDKAQPILTSGVPDWSGYGTVPSADVARALTQKRVGINGATAKTVTADVNEVRFRNAALRLEVHRADISEMFGDGTVSGINRD